MSLYIYTYLYLYVLYVYKSGNWEWLCLGVGVRGTRIGEDLLLFPFIPASASEIEKNNAKISFMVKI